MAITLFGVVGTTPAIANNKRITPITEQNLKILKESASTH